MKRILGLDLGTTSIGWALVNEAETESEQSSIVKLGVRVNPLTTDESSNYEKGKSVETNQVRRVKRSAHRNLQRYKQRRATLISILIKNGFITNETILSEDGSHSTYETYALRAKAVTEQISLEEFARVLLMINKKRGYKSSRKAKSGEDGKLIDGMTVAKRLYDENLTPGQLCFQILSEGKKALPDFYRSDLQQEFNRIWAYQSQFYPNVFTNDLKESLTGKNATQTWDLLAKHFTWTEQNKVWDEQSLQFDVKEFSYHLCKPNRKVKGFELKKENYEWRSKALTEKLHPESLAIVLQEINAEINKSSGYLGAISDRSKNLFFNHLTVGQFLMNRLNENRHNSLKNLVFYRQDYMDEFEVIWESQARFYPQLTSELKAEIRDVVIFFQRRLKSQKSLISICEFERKDQEVVCNGKTKTIVVGSRVIPRSSPLFQEFKIWQTLNNLEVIVVDDSGKKKRAKKNVASPTNAAEASEALEQEGRRLLTQEEKELLAEELSIKPELKKSSILKLLFKNPESLDLNFETVKGNSTAHSLYQAFSTMMDLSGHEPLDFKKPTAELKKQVRTVFDSLAWNIEILDTNVYLDTILDNQTIYKLWHLLYSFEGDNSATGDCKLKEKLQTLCGCSIDYVVPLMDITFEDDYGSLSAKAIRNILPYMKEGCRYDVACSYAGYRHSASSLNKEEIAQKELADRLELLPKNALRNPVVEKILNQMVNVVNEIIVTYGRPDEIRVELARELKKNQKEREQMTNAISAATKQQEKIKELLQKEFGISHPSRNDVIRYRLYEELKENGFKTLYSDTYIPREKLFSKEIDIEHIIPKARLFDDSFSNKTLEYRSVNINKGSQTAYDFVRETYGEEGLKRYLLTCNSLFAQQKTKLKKLKMTEAEIPDDFIERDLRNTQYIAKRALAMLHTICRNVVATSGGITEQLRKDWELVDVMKELNWDKYAAVGKVSYYQDRDGRQIGRITDWNKRNDHRHHAMDALTVAFTKSAFVQYFNNKNAAHQEGHELYGIRNAYFQNGRAIAPIPLHTFRAQALRQLEQILVSIKAKNKVVTLNVNKVRKPKGGVVSKAQLTPRGKLHDEMIYGSRKEYVTKEETVNASFDETKIATVCKAIYREALLWRLQQFGNDPKKAFTGKNSLEKNPIWLNDVHTKAVPTKVKTVTLTLSYAKRNVVSQKLNVDNVVDSHIRNLLKDRLASCNDNAEEAFSNLEETPIWLNKEQGICVKRVRTRYMFKNAESLHIQKDKDGNFVLDKDGKTIPVDFVDTHSNHHVAIYERQAFDKKGLPIYNEDGSLKMVLEEQVVSFYKAVARVNQGLPAIDKYYNSEEGWKFLYTMKQNEYFVFPNEVTGFNPKEIDLLDPNNYAMISPNLFRVQKIASKDYMFRHHLETQIESDNKLKDVTWKRISSLSILTKIVKVRINHLGQIVAVGEY
ncbi:MAG: type II CRISPR RNA-guided endonuclease Cas9 [Bacteroidaceae bacterium]|nr:type II CRISPR RNA-guided endonuclease Cas9 [Bacteroidaceae bacterium]